MKLKKIDIIDVKTGIANTLFRLGFRYRASTSIADTTTFGYGQLDTNGYFEYDISPRLVLEKRIKVKLSRLSYKQLDEINSIIVDKIWEKENK